jgi:hypothetical protein
VCVCVYVCVVGGISYLQLIEIHLMWDLIGFLIICFLFPLSEMGRGMSLDKFKDWIGSVGNWRRESMCNSL